MTNARATKENRQEKVAAMRAQVARAQARRRTLMVGSVVLFLIIALVAGFTIVQNARRDSETVGAAVPANLGPNNSITVGQASAPVTITTYEDFQCPACANFEQLNASQLQTWLTDGTVKVEYRPIAFLDRASTDRYSTRALNAAAALINSAPTSFAKFHEALFALQPAEGGPGLSDAQLIDLAVEAGAPRAAMATAVKELTYLGWTKQVTEDSSKAGVNSTPTVLVNGTALESYDPAVLKAAVDAAAKQ